MAAVKGLLDPRDKKIDYDL
jgi:tetratricopeptide (TPR) repeat protein